MIDYRKMPIDEGHFLRRTEFRPRLARKRFRFFDSSFEQAPNLSTGNSHSSSVFSRQGLKPIHWPIQPRPQPWPGTGHIPPAHNLP
jgi:hypothetical protein